MFARVADGCDHAVDSPRSESAGQNNSVTTSEFFAQARRIGKIFRIYPFDFDRRVVMDSRVS